MIIEQLIFIIIAFILFIYFFYKLIKENDTKYVPILAIQATGIAIKFIEVCFGNQESNFIIQVITYILSVLVPVAIILIEKTNSTLAETVDISIAKIYLLFGNSKGAKKILIKLIAQCPESYMAHKLLAQIYEKEGGQRKAVDEYAQAIDLNKQDYDSYYKIATLLTDLDKKDEAEQMLTNLLNKKPDHIEASIALGDLLIEKENYKEAVNIYSNALKYYPTSYEMNYNLGIAYTMLNDFQNAKICYEKAAELNSLVYNTKYSLAEIAVMYKELEEAEKYFLQATEDEELCADAYLELAKICLIKGNKEQAIKYANVAIQESPKKIVEKIDKDVTFAIIRAKLSIPFNLDFEEEKKEKLTKKEKLAKKHLEEMAEITKKIGYNDVGIVKKDITPLEKEESREFQKEREE